jgi:hypothetical protein
MSAGQDAPALIQYACERCKTRFVLPPSSRHLGFGGRFKAAGMAVSRTVRFHEGLGSTYDGARRQLLAKMDDDAYQSFVQSFKFCHECRQFVCSECWSASRKTCLGCFAKAAGTTVRQRPPFAPVGPSIPRPVAAAVPTGRRRRFATDASLLVMAAAVILLVVELFVILPNGNKTNGADPSNLALASPTASPTATPTAVPTASPTAAPTDTPLPIPTIAPTATPSPTPAPTAAPTRAPTARPATPRPTPAWPGSVNAICSWVGTTQIKCTWTNNPGRGTATWTLSTWDSNGDGTQTSAKPVTFSTGLTPGADTVYVVISYAGSPNRDTTLNVN